MSKCEHLDFKANVSVSRLTEYEGGAVNGFVADVTVNCANCGMQFQWLGVGKGLHPLKPMTSADGLELRAPIIPVEEL